MPIFPPTIPEFRDHQRWYQAGTPFQRMKIEGGGIVSVFRVQDWTDAEVQMIYSDHRNRAVLELRMTPAELRGFAQRLLDAAADIEQTAPVAEAS